MKPGRELDKLIAEKIFNHKVVHNSWGDKKQYHSYTIGKPDYSYTGDCPEGYLTNSVPCYSTDIKDAMNIFQKFSETHAVSLHSSHPGWTCYISEHNTVKRIASGNSDNIPITICLAALEFLEKDE